MKNRILLTLSISSLFLLSACMGATPKPQDLRLTAASLQNRQQQTRVYDTGNERQVLSSCSAVLQDIGFIIEESEMALGLLSGSKERSATQPAEQAIKIALFILYPEPLLLSWDNRQIMRVSVVTSPATEAQKQTAVRVTFQRVVFKKNVYYGIEQVRQVETVGSQEIYQEFFSKLSRALFLEAQKT